MALSKSKSKSMTISVLIVLSGVLLVVLCQAGGDVLVGNASHYTPIPFTRTACENKIGSSKLPPSVFPVAAGQKLWDHGAACGRRYRVRCASDGEPHFCKTGEEIEVSIQDRAATMRGRASEYGTDMVIPDSGFRVMQFHLHFQFRLNTRRCNTQGTLFSLSKFSWEGSATGYCEEAA